MTGRWHLFPVLHTVSSQVHICSENNFPTAAGLASSAAGYACLVASLARLYQLEGDLSALARWALFTPRLYGLPPLGEVAAVPAGLCTEASSGGTWATGGGWGVG